MKWLDKDIENFPATESKVETNGLANKEIIRIRDNWNIYQGLHRGIQRSCFGPDCIPIALFYLSILVTKISYFYYQIHSSTGVRDSSALPRNDRIKGKFWGKKRRFAAVRWKNKLYLRIAASFPIHVKMICHSEWIPPLRDEWGISFCIWIIFRKICLD